LRRRKIFKKTEKETKSYSCLYKKQQQAEAKGLRDAEKKAKAERLAANTQKALKSS
jgi:hypothetical protein